MRNRADKGKRKTSLESLGFGGKKTSAVGQREECGTIIGGQIGDW